MIAEHWFLLKKYYKYMFTFIYNKKLRLNTMKKFNLLYEEIIKNIVNEARELTFENKPAKIANSWKQNLLNILSDKLTNLNITFSFDDRRNYRRDRSMVNKWLCFSLTFEITPTIKGMIGIEIAPAQGNVYSNKEVNIKFEKVFYSEEHEFINMKVIEKRTMELTKERDLMTASEFPTPELINEILNIYQKKYLMNK